MKNKNLVSFIIIAIFGAYIYLFWHPVGVTSVKMTPSPVVKSTHYNTEDALLKEVGQIKLPTPQPGQDHYGYPRFLVEGIRLRSLLKTKQFSKLETELMGYFKESLQDFHLDNKILVSLDVLGSPDATAKPFYEEWINSQSSAIAQAAYARYLLNIAWHARGNGWGKNVTDEQWEVFQDNVKQSISASNQALKMDPNMYVAYETLIWAGIGSSIPAPEIQAYFEASKKIVPLSFSLHYTYMHSLLPRWGGSHEKMLQFAKSIAPYANKNPKLLALAGYVAWDQASMIRNSGNNGAEVALGLLDQALQFGELPEYLLEKAYIYNKNYSQADLDHSIPILKRAFEIAPNNTFIVGSLIWALNQVGRNIEANQLIDYAKETAPLEKYLKTWIEWQANQQQAGGI